MRISYLYQSLVRHLSCTAADGLGVVFSAIFMCISSHAYTQLGVEQQWLFIYLNAGLSRCLFIRLG